MSQADLARNSRLPRSVVNELENGVTKDPRLSTVVAIADALRVAPEYLISPPPHQRNAGSNLKKAS
jgi:transcriptional regulator with XRE-family HTH domain